MRLIRILCIDKGTADQRETTVVVLLHNTTSQTQTKTPTALLGGETRVEDVRLLRRRNALAVIGNFYLVLLSFVREGDTYLGSSGVHSILDDVLQDPTEERSGEESGVGCMV